MDAAKWDKEEEPCEVGVVAVTHTRVDPGTVMIHLHNTSGMGIHESSEGSSSITNPKPRGSHPSACSGTPIFLCKEQSHLGA